MRLVTTTTALTVYATLLVLVLIVSASMTGTVKAGDRQATVAEIATATMTVDDTFETVAVISNAELTRLRGGFDVSGLQIDIGANIRTYIDGLQVLESIVNLTGSELTAGGRASTDTVLNSPDFPGLQIVDSRGSGLAGLRDQIPAEVDLGALNGANGVILNDGKGFTAALHQINRSQILSALVNTANGRRLRQEVDVTVDIANFRQFQSLARSARKAAALSRAGRLN